MSPKMEANGGVGAGAVEDCSIDSSSEAGTERCAKQQKKPKKAVVTASPAPAVAAAVPLMAPAVKRKTCLRISTSPPVDSAGVAATTANKRATPRNIAVTAGSSSVVASKGMLFSRAELRSAPLSASRKYDGNVGFGFQSTSSAADTMNGNSGSSSPGWPASSDQQQQQQQQSSTGIKKASPARGGAAAAANFNAGSGSATRSTATATAAANPAGVRPSESFATLRIIEARRRAAWSFEPSPRTSSAASPPPPSLAALGSRSGSYRRRSPKGPPPGSTTARKTPMPMPPLPKMKSFAPTLTRAASSATASATATTTTTTAATATACPPLPPRHNNINQLLISAAYGGPSRRGAAAAPGAPQQVVAAPLSEPAGREKDRTRETLEQKWAAWQLENEQENQQGPAPDLGKPAAAPVVPVSGRKSFGECSGGGGIGGGGGGDAPDPRRGKGWGGVGDFPDKVAFLGDYVASVFGRAKKGVSVPQRYEVQYGVE